MRVVRIKRKPATVWRGPSAEGEGGGITFSLLSRWLCCRERFRLLVEKGLRPVDEFSHRLHYGQMWHACEEGGLESLRNYVERLCSKYPTQQEQIEHWYRVCLAQWPIYVRYWKASPDVTSPVKNLAKEKVFAQPVTLPSGRVVILRGRWDGVDQLDDGVYLFETKTKGELIEEQVRKQLYFDLQTGIYMVALAEALPGKKVKGFRYNVIRRPLSGGRGTIRQHQPTKSNPLGETKDEFYGRLGGLIEEEPGYYFVRWRVEYDQKDIAEFRRKCLDPILENLCWWWDCVRGQGGTDSPPAHWRHPFGVYNVLNEGGSSELDEYLASGSTVGLTQTQNLFEELQ